VLDKLTNLTVLNLSNTGVSYLLKITRLTLINNAAVYFPPQRDFTNTPHIDKLVNLTGKIFCMLNCTVGLHNYKTNPINGPHQSGHTRFELSWLTADRL